MLPNSSRLIARFNPRLLKGVTVVEGRAIALTYDAKGNVVQTPQVFTAIPYYAWANRGRGEMIVWIPNTVASGAPAR